MGKKSHELILSISKSIQLFPAIHSLGYCRAVLNDSSNSISTTAFGKISPTWPDTPHWLEVSPGMQVILGGRELFQRQKEKEVLDGRDLICLIWLKCAKHYSLQVKTIMWTHCNLWVLFWSHTHLHQRNSINIMEWKDGQCLRCYHGTWETRG